MGIEQLYHFLEIAKCHSLSQAAENLFIGKSTLSNSINSLENELQRELFVRTSKGTYLSPFGERILDDVEQIVQASGNIYNLSQLNPLANNRVLYIYSYPVGSISAVVKLLRYMNDHFPEASISVPETQSENIIRDLIASGHSIGLVSAGFLTHSYVKKNAENHDFVFEPVYEDSLFLFVNKKHPLSQLEHVCLDQLTDETVVIFRLFVLPDTNTFYQDFKNLKRCYSVDNYELLKLSLADEHMVAIAPSLAFLESHGANSRDIVKIPIVDCSVKLTTSLVYKKDREKLTSLELAAIDFLRDYYRSINEQKNEEH